MRHHFRATTLLGSLLALMVLSSLGAIGLVLERFVKSELGRQAGDSNRLLAASIGHEIFFFLDVHFSSLTMLDNADFRSIGGFDQLQRAFPAFEHVLMCDPSGRVVQASTSSGELGFDFAARDYFFIPWKSRQDFVSPPFISDTSYAPSAVLAHPNADGVAIAYISLSFLSDYMAGLPSSVSKSIALVDSSGIIVAHNTESSTFSRKERVSLEQWFRQRQAQDGSGQSIATRPTGVEEMLCWAMVPGRSGWMVLVSEPTEQVFRAVYVLRLALFSVLAVYAVAAILINIGILRLVRKDITALVRFSQEITEGRLNTSIAFRGFHDFAHLAINLELMGSAIRNREAQLRSNERRLFDLIEFMPVPVILLTRSMDIELINRSLTATLGWTKADTATIEDWWLAAYPDPEYREKVLEYWNFYIDQLVAGTIPDGQFKGSLRCKDGSSRTLIGAAALIAGRFVVTFVDITHADEAATSMVANLREKEVLLKEIHHRVKNNLQVIISLLSLKASSLPEVSHLFAESMDRIRVMSDIHELLYNSTDLSHIILSEYINTILQWLIPTYAIGNNPPEIDLNIEAIFLSIDQAIPCGLIINEVITNSLKYAFLPEQTNPRIRISTTRDSAGLIVLEMADNGQGMTPNLDPLHCDSLGLQLVVSLSSQMKGSWQLDRSAGTRWIITFKAG